ncbi:MAG: enoyl-CoA hydratase-related protein [Dehalococcoidia bacterium]
MAESPILYEAREGVAVITLNRPEVLNAFTPEMLGELAAALRRATDGSERSILLTGAGRGFSAGQDLASIQHLYENGGSPDFVSLLNDNFYPVVRELTAKALPVVAAVNGVAAGAGMSLALACDLRIAADNARFVTAFTNIGLVPDCGMAYTLPRLVGEGRALELMLLSEPLGAEAALAMGLVNRVVPAAELMEAAFTIAKKLAAGPTLAYRKTKDLVEAAQTSDFAALLAVEAEAQAEAGATEDHKGAVDAFLKKQSPTFSGR